MTLSKPTIAATACLTVFAGLAGAKLAGLVDWSWWWIAAPVWLPASIAAGPQSGPASTFKGS